MGRNSTLTFKIKYERCNHKVSTKSQESSHFENGRIQEDIAKIAGDILRLGVAAKRDIREAELRLKGKIDQSKSETLKWMVGSMGFQTIVILGAVFGLAPLFVH